MFLGVSFFLFVPNEPALPGEPRHFQSYRIETPCQSVHWLKTLLVQARLKNVAKIIAE